MEIPPARHHHSLTDFAGKTKEKIVFGGQNNPEHLFLNDVWIINFTNINLSGGLADVGGVNCTLIQCKGDVPPPRYGHTSLSYENSLYIFGGKT